MASPDHTQLANLWHSTCQWSNGGALLQIDELLKKYPEKKPWLDPMRAKAATTASRSTGGGRHARSYHDQNGGHKLYQHLPNGADNEAEGRVSGVDGSSPGTQTEVIASFLQTEEREKERDIDPAAEPVDGGESLMFDPSTGSTEPSNKCSELVMKLCMKCMNSGSGDTGATQESIGDSGFVNPGR